MATGGFDHRFAGGSTIAPVIRLAAPNEPSKSSPSPLQTVDSATGSRTPGMESTGLTIGFLDVGLARGPVTFPRVLGGY